MLNKKSVTLSFCLLLPVPAVADFIVASDVQWKRDTCPEASLDEVVRLYGNWESPQGRVELWRHPGKKEDESLKLIVRFENEDEERSARRRFRNAAQKEDATVQKIQQLFESCFQMSRQHTFRVQNED